MRKSILNAILLLGLASLPVGCAGCGEDVPGPDPEPASPPEPEADTYCQDQGFTSHAFNTDTGGALFGDLAEDFTVNEYSGDTFTLSEAWTGCDSYIFFSYFSYMDANARNQMDTLWASDFAGILQSGTRNVHYFYISEEMDASAREGRMYMMQTNFDTALQTLFGEDTDEIDFWTSRFHFVTDQLTAVEGGVGDFAIDYLVYRNNADPVDLGDRGQAYPPPPTSFAIDRNQRWDPVGSLSEYVGGPENLKMAAFNSAFYNHRAELKAHLAAQTDITVVELVDEMVTARVFNKDVTLPDADAMATMDTFEIDVEITCPHRNPFGCSEWDRIARMSLCTEYDAADIDTCTASTEIVRWITPYWRRGTRHWVMDASPFLALIKDGGVQRFRIEMGPAWERATERHATMSVRLSNQDKGLISQSVLRAFGGGSFNADYNSTHAPFTFTPPADATRIEIVTIISGHGQTSGNNCAEWCNHMHFFTVNGSDTPHEVSYSDIGNDVGCAARADEGAMPGQWGNWPQSRAGWCPGLPVETVRFDITGEITLGSENTLTYEASFNGNTPAGGDISKNTYVVWYQ